MLPYLTYNLLLLFSPDKNNSEHSIAQVVRGDINLPDRVYYFDKDKDDRQVAYKKTMALMLTLFEDPTATEPLDNVTATAEKYINLKRRCMRPT